MTHFLVVEDAGGEYDRIILHDASCTTEVIDRGPEPGQIWEEYTCGVGYWESNFGLDDLKDDPRFNTPGKYEISFYNYTPQSMFEDADAYLEFVDA